MYSGTRSHQHTELYFPTHARCAISSRDKEASGLLEVRYASCWKYATRVPGPPAAAAAQPGGEACTLHSSHLHRPSRRLQAGRREPSAGGARPAHAPGSQCWRARARRRRAHQGEGERRAFRGPRCAIAHVGVLAGRSSESSGRARVPVLLVADRPADRPGRPTEQPADRLAGRPRLTDRLSA